MEKAALVAGATEPVIRVRGFRKRYGRTVADDGIDLEVAPGQVYGLIGPDGAGKSSLMKAIAGVLEYDAGTVEVFGIPIVSEASAERIKGRIAFMPQGLGLNLYPELSVEENIAFFSRLRLVPTRQFEERKKRLLAMTRLEPFAGRLMKNLSGGMKQKLGLICALIHQPDLVILDEPTTGVDPVSRRDLWVILAEFMRESPMTALVSTAYLDEASRFDRLLLMHEGKGFAEGTPAEIRALGKRGPNGAEPDLEEVFISVAQGGEASTNRPDTAQMTRSHSANGNHADIQAEGLTRDFDGFRAVDDVTFCVSHGEIFGLLGANGAGKTTVIKMLMGLLPPTSGRGTVAGKEMQRAGDAIKRRIGYVSQAFSLYQDLTALENIRLYCGIYGLGGRETRERADWILQMAGLAGYERILSGRLPLGLRQRLALGCALVHRPQVLFLDEPTSGVDPLGRRRLWEIIVQLAREDGVAILITTHYMSEAERCDRLGLMHAGRLIADASPAELKKAFERDEGRKPESMEDVFVSRITALEAQAK